MITLPRIMTTRATILRPITTIQVITLPRIMTTRATILRPITTIQATIGLVVALLAAEPLIPTPTILRFIPARANVR